MSVYVARFISLSPVEVRSFAAERSQALGVKITPALLDETVENLAMLQAHARTFLASPLAGDPERDGGG
jgi:hypothetical protein